MPKGGAKQGSSSSSMTKNDNYEKTEASIAAKKATQMKAKVPRAGGPPKSQVVC